MRSFIFTRMQRWPRLLLLALVSTWANPAWALGTIFPMESVIDEAHLIVEGEVVETTEEKLDPHLPLQCVAKLKVWKTLKSLPQVVSPNDLCVVAPTRQSWNVSPGTRFAAGEYGIWMLAKDPDFDIFRVMEVEFQSQDFVRLAERISQRDAIVGGTPQKGLVARAELITHAATTNRKGYFEVRLSLKNVTRNSLIVCDYHGHVEFDIVRPDGRTTRERCYWGCGDIGEITAKSFHTLLPGAIRHLWIGVGPEPTGICFASSFYETNPDRRIIPGKHQATVVYTNRYGGQQFGLKGVWTGTVSANAVSFTVAKPWPRIIPLQGEVPFRLAAFSLLLVATSISLYHRRRAATAERFSFLEEGYTLAIFLRLAAGLCFSINIVAYLLLPSEFAQLPINDATRWSAAIVAALLTPILYWSLLTLGHNLTDTVVPRSNATLVTHGPYRWVRHPFYVTAGLLMISLGILAANWIIGLNVLLVLALLTIRTQDEERLLRRRFGMEYASYVAATGMYVPRILWFARNADGPLSVTVMPSWDHLDR